MNTNPTPYLKSPRRHRLAAWVMAPIVIGAGAASLAGQTADALSPTTVWTHVASTCSPDEASFQRYDNHVSDFKHAPGATGQIVTRCNIVNLPEFGSGEIPVLEVVYRDQDGPGTGQRVRAELIRVDNAGASLIIKTFDSNGFSASPATQKRYVTFDHAFNFHANAYFVQIRIDRTTTSTTPLVTTVRLTQIVG